MSWGSKKLRGHVSTRMGVFVGGIRTSYAVDPGLQDTIVPLGSAQISALATRNTSAVSVHHTNAVRPPALPGELNNYLNSGRRAGLLPAPYLAGSALE